MKQLVVVGAGTAGTMVANRMTRKLSKDWRIILIDPEPEHLYQPGLLFLPFGARDERRIRRVRANTRSQALEWVRRRVRNVAPNGKAVWLEDGGRVPYDLLVIASGSTIRPDQTEGLLDSGWRKESSTLHLRRSVSRSVRRWSGSKRGRLLVNVVEMPVQCPVAPLEFQFLSDAYFRERRLRDRVELVYATPLDSAFTKPLASRLLGDLLVEKGIRVEADFATGSVDAAAKKLVSYDEREIPYDLLVAVPTHMGASFVEASGMGNELSFVPTHPRTPQAKEHEDIFVLGDATDLPSSKAGSVGALPE